MIFGAQGQFWYLLHINMYVHDISNTQNSCGQSGVNRKAMPYTRPRYLFVHVTKHNSG